MASMRGAGAVIWTSGVYVTDALWLSVLCEASGWYAIANERADVYRQMEKGIHGRVGQERMCTARCCWFCRCFDRGDEMG